MSATSMSKEEAKKELALEAHEYHANPIPGKYEIAPSKPLGSQEDLKMAYLPGIKHVVEEIISDPSSVYDFTNKNNTVCVITNGTAVLGLGDIGPLASKPVMEGKGVLLKKFGNVNGVDLEVNTKDPDEFINCVKLLGPSFGGINLEDIKGPECFYIEKRLKEIMDIPVFHDDQHGTAIITSAGVINACHLTNRKLEDIKVVFNGAGAAGIACLQMLLDCGVKNENAFLCDSRGVIYKGRTEGMNEWKEKYANDTELRTMEEALEGADVFVGVSKKDALNPEWIKKMNGGSGDNPDVVPIIFALANPDPEILPEKAKEICPNVIIATGRSDYPNQINNVMCFPYLFRGVLDVRASTISENMKIATAYALAELAREEVPKEVEELYGRELKFGPEYIIPTPFDPRLLVRIANAVSQAARDEGNCQ
ncbi:unnamed protein product [Moneuplotes crassus]|uniref:NADP-dependent malic enzyme n=1 Tax=Euplotes crassus TaxID=5936 RepID=A0AAD1U878_EUPCR|nr:unnamed protein product [Moneuplotes crassus]